MRFVSLQWLSNTLRRPPNSSLPLKRTLNGATAATCACSQQVGATRSNPLLGTRALARGYAKESRTNSCGSLRVYSLSSPIYIPQISFQIIFLLSLRSIYLGRKKNLFYQLSSATTILLNPLSRYSFNMGSPQIFNLWGERRQQSP